MGSDKKKKKKEPKKPTAPDLNGTWRYQMLLQLVDPKLAISMGLTDDGKTALPYGTYTDQPTFTVYMSDKDGVKNAILDIFDEKGNFCRFVWNGVDTWNSVPDPIQYNFEGDASAKPPLQSASIVRYPTLLLSRYDATKGPWDICPKGPTYISVSGDGGSAPPQPLPDQCITQKDIKSFVWHSGKDWGTKGADPDELEFSSVTATLPMPVDLQSWGACFVAQSGLAQLDFPYYGFDPRSMDIFSLTGTSSGTGTGTSGDTNTQGPGGSLNLGALIFEYPEEGSKDYVQASDLPHQPYLPLGTSGKVIENFVGGSFTQMVSTLADMSHSWSATLGLSAGVEGLLSVGGKRTYAETIETQRKNESRFTITRNVGYYWTCFIERLTMKLTDNFQLKINDGLNNLLEGLTANDAAYSNGLSIQGRTVYGSDTAKFGPSDKGQPIIGANIPTGTIIAAVVSPSQVTLSQAATASGSNLAFTLPSRANPDWQAFVGDFGTHYLYAMTQGDMEFSLTELTFQSQVDAFNKSIDISATVEGIIDGGTVKTDADFKNELKKTKGIDFSNEISHYFRIGEPNTPGVGIFFDLRPLTELMSPIFFRYDPGDDIQKRAPWVWYKLRESFNHYLESLGLNKPLDPSFLNDLTPHQFKVTFQSIKVTGPQTGLSGCGSVTPKVEVVFPQSLLPSQGQNVNVPTPIWFKYPEDFSGDPEGVYVDNPSYVPDSSKVFVALAAKIGDELNISMDVNFTVYYLPVAKHEDDSVMPIVAATFVNTSNGFLETLRKGTDLQKITLNNNGYTMELEIAVQDLGPLVYLSS